MRKLQSFKNDVVFNDFFDVFLSRTRIANPVKGIVSVFKLAGKLVLLGVNFYSKCRHIFIYIYISYTWILWVLNCGGVYNSETFSCFYCRLGRSPTTCVSFLLFSSRQQHMSGIDGISDSLLDSNLHRCFKMAALKLVIETEKIST